MGSTIGDGNHDRSKLWYLVPDDSRFPGGVLQVGSTPRVPGRVYELHRTVANTREAAQKLVARVTRPEPDKAKDLVAWAHWTTDQTLVREVTRG